MINRISLQPKTTLSRLLLSCSRRSHQFTPLRTFQIDFPSCTISIHLPHNSIVGREKWDVMRCEPSPCKCCCPHLSPDSASSFVCVHRLPSATAWVLSFHTTLPSICLPSSLVPEWFSFPAFTSLSPSLLSNVSSDRSFVFSVPLLSLFGTSLRQERRLRSFWPKGAQRHLFPFIYQIWKHFLLPFFLSTPNFWFYQDILGHIHRLTSPSHHFFIIPHLHFSPQSSILFVILAPWTLEMNCKRRRWTPARPSPLTLLGHHLILALTSRQSALTKA